MTINYSLVSSIILVSLAFLRPGTGFGQDELKRVTDGTSALEAFFGDAENTIETVRLLSDAETRLNVSVNFTGFSDQPYEIVGSILTRSKKSLKGVKSIRKPLPSRGDNVDLSFTFVPEGTYTNSYVKSHFLQIQMKPKSDEDSLLSGLDELIDGGISLDGTTYLYHLQKDWRVGGTKSMVIKVTLTPIGQAKTLKPGQNK